MDVSMINIIGGPSSPRPKIHVYDSIYQTCYTSRHIQAIYYVSCCCETQRLKLIAAAAAVISCSRRCNHGDFCIEDTIVYIIGLGPIARIEGTMLAIGQRVSRFSHC